MLYAVLEGLTTYVLSYMLQWRRPTRTLDPPNPIVRHLLRLQTEPYFFKPLQMFGLHANYAHHVLHQLLERFDALYACEALRPVVVFPIGFMGYPAKDDDTNAFLGQNFRLNLETVIGDRLLGRAEVMAASAMEKVGRKRKTTSQASSDDRATKKRRSTSASVDNDAADRTAGSASHVSDAADDHPQPPGYPIVVYPRLDSSWHIAGVTYFERQTSSQFSTVYVPEQHRKAFYDEVCRVVVDG